MTQFVYFKMIILDYGLEPSWGGHGGRVVTLASHLWGRGPRQGLKWES